MKPILLLLFFVTIFTSSHSQNSNKVVSTIDIDNFWEAFDSIRSTSDTLKQLNFINQYYIDKESPGLRSFRKLRGYTPSNYLKLINIYPKFWNSIRPNTLSVKNKVDQIEKSLEKFKEIYPEMSPVKMYFTIGGLRSGGTTNNNEVLIGSEIATADKNTDASELGHWLQNVFANQDPSNLVGLNIHECVHTQQRSNSNILLGHSIQEGSCDFIEELVMEKELITSYTIFGRAHVDSLKEAFKQEMFSNNYINWLYNGNKSKHADLGYFIGYAICKDYYNKSTNKRQAVKDIIQLNFSNKKEVNDFVNRSRFFKEPISEGNSTK